MHLAEDTIEAEHRKIGALIAKSNVDYLLCYGDASKFVLAEAVKQGFPADHAAHMRSKRELELELMRILAPGDVLLIKGGRRMYLNSTIRKLFLYTVSID